MTYTIIDLAAKGATESLLRLYITSYGPHSSCMECVDAHYTDIPFPDDVVVKTTTPTFVDGRVVDLVDGEMERTERWYMLCSDRVYEIWRGGEPRLRLTPHSTFVATVL